jgi:hypothetical protein
MKTLRFKRIPSLLLLLVSLGSCDLFQRIGGENPLEDVVRNNPVDPGVSTPIDTGLQPADGETIQHTTPVFQWMDFENVGSYRIQLSTTESFEGTLEADIFGIEIAQYHLTTPLQNARTYYWRVQPRYVDGTEAGWSSIWSVAVQLPIPTATAPVAGASVNTPRPTLGWTAEAEAAQYQLEVGETADFSSAPVEEAATTGQSYHVVGLLADTGAYYWRVRIVDSEGILGDWSAANSFSVSLPKPVLTAPMGGEVILEKMPRLDWQDVPDAQVYHIQVGLASDFSAGTLYDTQDPASSEFPVPAALAIHTRYYWRVRAMYGAEYFSAWSDVADFEASGIKWRYNFGNFAWGTPAVGTDETIYYPSGDLVALTKDGSLKWKYYDAYVRDVAIGSNGAIYAVSPAYLIALDPNGFAKWSHELWNSFRTCPALGSDDTIYVVAANNSLHALSPAGELKWSATLVETGYLTVDPVIAPDGTIYIPAEGNLYALNPDGSQKWTAPAGWAAEYEYAVGQDGTVYVPGTYPSASLTAIDPNGLQKWSFLSEKHTYGNSPALGEDGTIYLGMQNTLYAINPDGSEKWHLILAEAPGVADVYSTVAVGADGTVYFGTAGVDTGKGNTLTAVDPSGSIKWQDAAPRVSPQFTYFFGIPAIGPGGIVYVGSGDSCLYAIETSSTGLADSAWPMYRHDPQHTGRVSP